MKQQPDKLFRDKLLSHSQDVPPLLWDRIEGGLDKKKSSFTWLFVAASITVAIAGGYLFYTGALETNNTELAGIQRPVDSTIIESAVPVQDQTVEAKILTAEATAMPVKPKSEGQRNTTEKTKNTPAGLPAEQLLLEETIEPVRQDSTGYAYGPPTPQLAFRAQPKREENITIVITAEQTNQYLVNNKISEATSEEKKPSTLKKLLKKAADLKVNQDPFGDLRQKKNEILALNFKSEKQRGQKK
jgi:hypothetical protein